MNSRTNNNENELRKGVKGKEEGKGKMTDRDSDEQTVCVCIYIFMCIKCTVLYTHSLSRSFGSNICVLVVNICARLVRVFAVLCCAVLQVYMCVSYVLIFHKAHSDG